MRTYQLQQGGRIVKLLIIEDNPDLSKILKKGFTKKGYIVETALDGVEGNELAFIYDYDLIILDLNLPKMDGLEVLESIRKEKPNQRILILSARNEVEDRINGLNTGADDYLPKPFDFGELEARVCALLRREFLQIGHTITWKTLSFDTNTKKLLCNKTLLELSPKELGRF